MTLFAMSSLRVDHNLLIKQLQSAYIAAQGNADSVKKFAEALEVKNASETQNEESYARDRARLKADLATRMT